jgi:hypothetical protein
MFLNESPDTMPLVVSGRFITSDTLCYMTLHAPLNQEWETQPGANGRLIGGPLRAAITAILGPG